MGKCSTKNKNRSFSNSPSVNQVETMAHSSEANVMDIHDYAISMALRSDADIIPLPETPEKLPVAKKSRVTVNDDVPNSVLLAAIEKIGKLQEESLARLQSVELSVQENTASNVPSPHLWSSLARKSKTLIKELRLWRIWFLPWQKKMNLFGSHAWNWMNTSGDRICVLQVFLNQ